MLPKRYRLFGHGAIEATKTSGSLFPGKFCGLIVRNTQANNPPRVAFIVSARVAKQATARNRIKRRLREAVKPVLPRLKEGYEGLILAKKDAITAETGALREDLSLLMRQAGMMSIKQPMVGEDDQKNAA